MFHQTIKIKTVSCTKNQSNFYLVEFSHLANALFGCVQIGYRRSGTECVWNKFHTKAQHVWCSVNCSRKHVLILPFFFPVTGVESWAWTLKFKWCLRQLCGLVRKKCSWVRFKSGRWVNKACMNLPDPVVNWVGSVNLNLLTIRDRVVSRVRIYHPTNQTSPGLPFFCFHLIGYFIYL